MCARVCGKKSGEKEIAPSTLPLPRLVRPCEHASCSLLIRSDRWEDFCSGGRREGGDPVILFEDDSTPPNPPDLSLSLTHTHTHTSTHKRAHQSAHTEHVPNGYSTVKQGQADFLKEGNKSICALLKRHLTNWRARLLFLFLCLNARQGPT